MLQPYQQYYQQILIDPSVPSLLQSQLQDYGQPNYHSTKQTFPLCGPNDTPEFFKTNLLSPNRIIKYLNGEYCVYRAFYFQLFKLMFQIQNQEKDYLEMFKQIIFDPNIIQRNGQNSRAKRENSRVKNGSNQQNQSDSSRLSEVSEQQAFKRQFQSHQKCIAHFTQKVLQNKHNFSSFQYYLPYYPQIDQSMVLILETFIENANQNQEHEMDSIQSILEYLCQIFEIQLVVIENCFKFEESDVFLYIQQKQDDQVWVYIAFNQILDDEGDNQGEGNQQFPETQPYHNQPSNIQQSNQQNNRYPRLENLTSYQQQQIHSPSHIQYRPNSHNSYSSSSNQNPSVKDQQSLRDNQSSSYRDNVITSQMKAQQSNHKFINNHYSPNNHNFISKSPNQFNFNAQDTQGNRPNRISSDMGISQQNNTKLETENPLTKSYNLPNNYQKPHNSKYNGVQDLANKTTSSYIWNQNINQNQNQNQNSQQSSYNLPSALSQSNVVQSSKRQGRNFQKKVRYFDQDSIIEQSNSSNKQLTKMQSITESYREDTFHKQPQKDHDFTVKKNQHESSIHVVQSSHLRNTTDKKVTDSKAQTIINMFGDMLGSCANINTFDGIHGSNSSIANGFATSSHHKMQPEQDHSSNPNKDSYSKKYKYAYGTSTNIVTGGEVGIDGNNVNMKKTKSQQVIFEAKPKQSADVFRRVQIKESTIVRNQCLPKSSFNAQTNKIHRANDHDQRQNNKILMDSQELRNNGNTNSNFNYKHHNNGYYPFRNMGMGQSGQNQQSISRQRQELKQSPQNSDKQYLDNIQAKSYWGQQAQSNRNKSKPGSFHNSSRGSAKSHHLQQEHQTQAPNIKVNSIKSESDTSSRQMNRRNNYYRDDDFTQLEYDSNWQLEDDNCKRGAIGQGDPLIRSEENLNSRSRYQGDKHTKKYTTQEQAQLKGSSRNKLSSLAHQYKSQQYVKIPQVDQTRHNYNQKNHISRAYTSNNHQSSVHPSKNLQTQNTQQEDDFFFHPKNKSSIKYGLKTIQQVRASKQTNKDSYQMTKNPSKITNHDTVVEQGEDKLHKYELVNSITGMTQSIHGNAKHAVGQPKGTQAVNKLLNNNTYKFKEIQHPTKQLNDQSLNNGTFYKQFTNSKVLKLLKQPYQTKVQILKNRFKGQHRISLNNKLFT